MLTDLISFDTMLLMSKKPIDNPVTETVFNREIQALHKRMDSVDSSAGRMTHELLKTKEEVQDIKKSMSTKDDINTVLLSVAKVRKNPFMLSLSKHEQITVGNSRPSTSSGRAVSIALFLQHSISI